jgi:hypothetical protein
VHECNHAWQSQWVGRSNDSCRPRHKNACMNGWVGKSLQTHVGACAGGWTEECVHLSMHGHVPTRMDTWMDG